MIRRPPRSTRTDTLVPYTTLFRSPSVDRLDRPDVDPEDYAVSRGLFLIFDMGRHSGLSRRIVILQPVVGVLRIGFVLQQKSQCDGGVLVAERVLRSSRSEARRAGNECAGTCSSRWSPEH